MNEISLFTKQLPEVIEDVADFVVVNEEKLNAVKAAIRAARKTNDVNLEKLEEQRRELEVTVILAQCKLGELTKDIPKATNGGANQFRASFQDSEKSKGEQLAELGITYQRANEYERMAAHPEAVQRVIETEEHPTKAAVLQKIKQSEREERATAKRTRKAYTPKVFLPSEMCKLFVADIRDGLPMIESESVDFIITDPPYPREYLPLFSDLSRIAERVLKPGGSLLVMSGQSYLPEVIQRLSENMEYHWCLSYATPGGQSPQLFNKKVNTFWKPVLWFTKGKYDGDWIGDSLKSDVNDNDKRFHEWGQSISGFNNIISRFCYPGDIVLDPFLGGGTTGISAVLKGCKFIGADIDESNVETSTTRIMEVYVNARSTT